MNLIDSVKNKTIESNHILLQPLTKSYVTSEYLRWLNSKVVNEFLESRFVKYTLKSLKDYVSFCEKDKNTFFFAIIDKSTQKHIGNIKLGPINWNHKFAEIGIMIGDKSYWGRGIATE